MKLLPCRSATEMLHEVLELGSEEKLLIISLLWSWWHERNRGRHGEPHQSVSSFQYNARRYVDEWKLHLQPKQKTMVSIGRRWEAPPSEFLKINIDASYHETLRSGGWGAICRDSMHDIIFATASSLEMIDGALHAESYALSHAVQIADQLGMGKVIF